MRIPQSWQNRDASAFGLIAQRFSNPMGRTDDIHAERIRSLTLWSGPIRLQPLDGGITNRNYLVDDGASVLWHASARNC